MKPTLLWVRRDMRLSDNAALAQAIRVGAPIIPVFILTEDTARIGAAARWRLEQALKAFGDKLTSFGSGLVMRKGAPDRVLARLIRETGAGRVYWSHCYDRTASIDDVDIANVVQAAGASARQFRGFLLFDPWDVRTGKGDMYRVYSPFWRAVRDRAVPRPIPAPSRIPAPDVWPASETLEDLALSSDMHRGAAVLAAHSAPGEARAQARLDWFLTNRIHTYKEDRDFVNRDATSGMSEYLSYGEISPRTLWRAGLAAIQRGSAGAEHFLKELVWREFAWHLFYHTPHLATRNWRADWDRFPWRADNEDATAWKKGLTGVPMVDAAMRQMYVTGRMHNRARMIAASYLTKHLLTDWRVGLAWFADCLTDWDPASNAMGWQWVAGSGPDAAPYFRIFNPETQREKFDPDGKYVGHWIAEGHHAPSPDALAYFDATPECWSLSPDAAYPSPRISLADGRNRALAALDKMKS